MKHRGPNVLQTMADRVQDWLGRGRRRPLRRARLALKHVQDRTAPALVTSLVKVINPAGISPGPMVHVSGTLFFAADDGINGTELWKSDGTAAGTALFKDIN